MRFEAALVVVVLGLPACGSSGERPSPVAGENGDTGPDVLATNPDASPGKEAGSQAVCVEGSQRTCKVTLPSHGQINNCFVGVEICENGQWGPCSPEPEPDPS